MNGFGTSLYRSMQSFTASISSSSLWNIHRRIRLSVISLNHRSTWFGQDELVGTKWKWNREWRAAQR